MIINKADHTQIVIRTFILLSCILVAVAFVGCEESRQGAASVKNNSIPEFKRYLPNLREWDVQSVEFVIEKSSSYSIVPSPSDIHRRILGSVKILEDTSGELQAMYDWHIIEKEDIPKDLALISPTGEMRVSGKLNKSFNDNPYYAHGIVLVVGGDWGNLYFIVNDIDHPLE